MKVCLKATCDFGTCEPPLPWKVRGPGKMRLYIPNLEFSNQSHTTSLEFFGEPTLTQTLGSTFDQRTHSVELCNRSIGCGGPVRRQPIA